MLAYFDTDLLIPPYKTDPEKVRGFVVMMRARGWDPTKPVLVGYVYEDKIQLLNGSNRRAAAASLRLRVPVVVHDFKDVQDAWGLPDQWKVIMASGDVENRGKY